MNEDKMRAEFEAWWGRSVRHTGNAKAVVSLTAREAWQAAHASRQHEVDALRQQMLELSEQVEMMRAFILKVSKQKPEKPDYWNSCAQCERNENEADELLTSTPSSALSAHDNEVAAKALEDCYLMIESLGNDFTLARLKFCMIAEQRNRK